MPLHPLIVHFPIALLIMGTIIEILALKYKEKLSLTGTILLTTGVITGIISYLTGDSAEHFAEMHFGEVEYLIHQHEEMAQLSLITFGIATVFKWITMFTSKFNKALISLVILFSIGGSVALGITGHLGGKIVYENDKVKQAQVQIQDTDKD